MAERRIKWTAQQLRAIAARDRDVLVTASAGTGKTAVLSGRCVDIVSDKRICSDVLGILVLTFTEAAAEQMRSRIAEQLGEAFLQERDPHLRNQQQLLQAADISTIHSFCKRLITEHFYKLDLDPTFRVIDGDEQRLLKAETLEKTIEWAWEQSHLAQGLRLLFYRRNLRLTDGFLAKVIAISDFLDGVVSRDGWCERAAVFSEAANAFAGTLGQKQKQIIAAGLQRILNQLKHARTLYEQQGGDAKRTAEYDNSFIEPVVHCIELLKAGDFDRCAEQVRNFAKPPVHKPKGLAEPVAGLIQKMIKSAVDSFAALSELAVLNPDYLDRVGRPAGLQTRVLIELVKKFDRLYSGAKRAVNCLDFADLEHYALRLLSDNNCGEDEPSPSETALALRRKYKFIFVDEYQDINSVQQAILELLGRGDNVFGVGDVKQSIYAWRGAEPALFLEKLRLASVKPTGPAAPLRVDLNANFRSTKGILDFVNRLFSRIMTASFTKMDYDESARLRPACEAGSEMAAGGDGKPVVEFHILEEQEKGHRNNRRNEPAGDQETNLISNRQRQAAVIARRIRQMVGADTGKAELQIYDKRTDKFRDIEYRDIVVLMRSLAKKANDYVEVLRLAGVPVSCDAVAGYFEATEITDLLSLLKVLDNPQRDIELAAVSRSPLFGITDDELAGIRIHARAEQQSPSFYESVRRYGASGPDRTLAEKLKNLIGQIENWRTLGRRGSLADLVWQVYRETGYLSFVSALPNGQARRANLLKLHDRAIQFEGFASSTGIASLARFVEFIEKLQEVGQDWAPAEPDSSAQNAVRILSVHKSKGLEFPVVFLAELNSRFNKSDVYDQCLTSADDTLGLQIIDRQSNSSLSSLAHQVIAEEKLATTLAEEMRILYVATTRARDRLVLTASERKEHCRDIICGGFFFADKPVGDWQLRSCQSPLEWLLYGLSDQKNLHRAFETGLAEQAVDTGLFDLRLYDRGQLQDLSGHILRLKAGRSRQPRMRQEKASAKKTGGELLAQVKESLAWRYSFGGAHLVPAKMSVTQMTHHDDEYVSIDYSKALDRLPVALVPAEGEPAGPVEGRLIGTATHLVIGRLDLKRPITEDTIEETIQELITAGAVTKPVAAHIDSQSILKFFESELGRIVLGEENTVWREWPFTFVLPVSEWQADDALDIIGCDQESIVVQGIIDVLVRTPAGLVVIDFKTDRITAAQVADRSQFYRKQLSLYGRAAAAILELQPVTKWLYFLTPQCAREV